MATVKKQEAQEQEVDLVSPQKRLFEADKIIKNHMMVSLGFGIVPLPIVDLVGLMGTQLNMLRNLSALYGQNFTKEWGKKSIASLVGGGVSVPVAMGLSSLMKSIPVIGQTSGVISMATMGAGTTYAIGKVFVQHFESGGTFLTFDPMKVREYFEEELKKGKDLAKNMKETPKATA
jgi:uncharacterized protein (DUF697 family)